MFRSKPALALAAAAAAMTLAGLSACSSSSASSGSGMPTVTMMVGGIDKQIYLPYQLAQGLGFYQKYGVNMELSAPSRPAASAPRTAMASGQVDFAGAWYVHTIDFQLAGKNVIDVAQLVRRPRRAGDVRHRLRASPRRPSGSGKTVGVTDLGSGHRRPDPVPGRPVPPDHEGLHPGRRPGTATP